MIVTKTWLNEWIDLAGISTTKLAETFNSIGLEVDRIKSYDVPQKIVFGRVLECEKHPDADKLNVCKVDIGSSIRQIVCGASNVRVGLDVVVAMLGAVMPSGLAIKPVKLRGIDSEGMICSASEIGLEDVNAGILELDSSIGEYKLGQEVRENRYFSDDLIEIELTANRGDCLSIRGVARDLSAAFDRPLKNFSAHKSNAKRGIGRVVNVAHDKKLDVNLSYSALDLKELEVPFIVKLRLAQIDEECETDLDSFLLYATHTSGVILNAYEHKFFLQENSDMAKVKLDEDEDGYACIYGLSKASVVGVMQSKESKVQSSDSVVLLEASYIPPDIVSKKMYTKKIDSDARFYNTSRGSEPQLNIGSSYCLDLLESNSDASVFSGSIEVGNAYKDKIVSISKQEIDNIIGAKIDKVTIGKILTNLGFNISKSSTDNFVISVPQFRHDIVNKQDIVEEIVRLVGIDNIPSKPFETVEKNRLKDDYFEYKKRSVFRHRAAQSGFFESVHFVFDEKKILESYNFDVIKGALELLNPIVSTLDTLRPTLLTGLLKAASQNVKNGYSSVKLFEIGSVFSNSREESLKMACIFSGERESESFANSGKPAKVDFAYFTQKIVDIIGAFELKQNKTTHTLSHEYQSAQIVVDGEIIGELFRVHPNVEKDYDLEITYMCEIDFSKVVYKLKTATKASKYQASFRDLSLVMPENMSYEKVKEVINKSATKELIRFYPVDSYSDEELGKNVSLSIRFVLQSDEKTLEEDDITVSMDAILNALKAELSIELR